MWLMNELFAWLNGIIALMIQIQNQVVQSFPNMTIVNV